MSTSPLPEGWVSKESKSRPGVTYYFNTTNRETTWSKPTQAATAHVKKKRKKERGNDEGEKVQVECMLHPAPASSLSIFAMLGAASLEEKPEIAKAVISSNR